MDNIVSNGKTEGWSQAKYREAAKTMLSEVRQQLRAGTIGLNKNMRAGATKW